MASGASGRAGLLTIAAAMADGRLDPRRLDDWADDEWWACGMALMLFGAVAVYRRGRREEG